MMIVLHGCLRQRTKPELLPIASVSLASDIDSIIKGSSGATLFWFGYSYN